MPSRRRLGVALIPDPPVRDEMEGLRMALGDPSLGRVVPHLTLVPPVNVRAGDLGPALAVLRAAASAQSGPLRLTAGPPATFLPDNPVLFLQVGGEIERLRELRDATFRPPLERALSWPWVPHFTLADGIDERRILSALDSLDRYAGVVEVDRVVMLEELRGRTWTPIADARLGPPVVVGTGGLSVRITRGRIPDPLALEAIHEEEESGGFWLGWPDPAQPLAPMVLTAHRGTELVGTAAIRNGKSGPRAAVFVLREARDQGVGGQLLARLESDALDAGWDLRSVTGEGPAGFYESRSALIRPAEPASDRGSEPTTRTRRRRTGRAS